MEKEPLYKKWWYWLVIIGIFSITFICTILILKPDEPSSTRYPTTNSTTTNSSSKNGITETVSQINAVRSAKNYLNVLAFSRSGLIRQLEYEGFSTADATYGADHSGANWYEQAAKKAKDYLDTMPFSKQGLINQLEYEGFTYEQAVYGVERNGF